MKDTAALAGKDRYSMEDLLEIMTLLRAPDGCPWDREQDHKSIRRDLLEECYEAIEAIDTDNPELLCEELGDVLLQVVFHSELEREAGRFDFSDVVDGVARKMVVRHPHVFGTAEANTSEDVLRNWDAIKRETKAQETERQVLQSVSAAMPALMRAQKLLKKGAGFGRDAGETAEIRDRLSESAQTAQTAEDVGALLLAAVELSRRLGVDAERALFDACRAYIDSFPGK